MFRQTLLCSPCRAIRTQHLSCGKPTHLPTIPMMRYSRLLVCVLPLAGCVVTNKPLARPRGSPSRRCGRQHFLLTTASSHTRQANRALTTTRASRKGESDIDLLRSKKALTPVFACAAFSPDHGLRDRGPAVPNGRSKSGLPCNAVARNEAPPYGGVARVSMDRVDCRHRHPLGLRRVMIYTMRTAARLQKQITCSTSESDHGVLIEGPVLDSLRQRQVRPEAGPPTPLSDAVRHGMTMGELARFFTRS